MRIEVPDILSNFDGFNAITKISHSLLSTTVGEQIILDFHRCRLFDSNMAAPLRMVIEHSNHLADVEHVQPDVAVVLRQNHFLSDYGFSAMPSFANAQLPLLYCNCNSSATYNQYVTVLTTMCIPVNVSLRTRKIIKFCLHEIMENACWHSQSEIGFFCCANYRYADQRLCFTFSDSGIGIKSSIQSVFSITHDLDDVEAIEWAIQGGHTTKQGLPGGLGLNFVRECVQKYKGKLYIVSGKGFCSLALPIFSRKLTNDLCGTTLYLEIDTSNTI